MIMNTKMQMAVLLLNEFKQNLNSGKPLRISDIAKKHDKSADYLQQVATVLRKLGWITSVRGPGGGYILARETIIFSEVVKEFAGRKYTSCDRSVLPLMSQITSRCENLSIFNATQN